MKVAILGGGAAGFFAAISTKTHHPDAEVTLFEKSTKLLAKVKVSGGGRCNVTNACFDVKEFLKNYPRGDKQLRKTFSQFSAKDTVDWFESRGVKLKAEADNRMFPVTDNSQTIIDCLMKEVNRLGIIIKTNFQIISIEKKDEKFYLKEINGREIQVEKVIVATGGSAKAEGFTWLEKLNHTIVPPVPSLFTFNIPANEITELMGVSVAKSIVKIQGTKLKQQGPLLVTHWGLSGPAVLKLSAWGARILNEMNYNFNIHVNWTGEQNDEKVREEITQFQQDNYRKKISNVRMFSISERLWLYLLKRSNISNELIFDNFGKDNLNKLVNTLTNDEYSVKGKTTFKEEFVTCGGVNTNEINFQTMESKVCQGLYFAGEVLDVDGVTGGFNFQAAWTTGFIAGKRLN